jgi:SAM-dependent methyltransferase
MTLVFWTTYRTRVPLYLTSARARDAIAGLLPPDRPFRFVDLGCGLGGLLRALSSRCPAGSYMGVELAPLPALLSRLRLAGLARCEAVRGDFWQLDFAGFDVIYAFLSPAPMQALWRKIEREARPGTLFISNSFPVPGVAPHEQIPLRESGGRALYVWRL